MPTDASITYLEQATRYAAEVDVLADLQARLAAWLRLYDPPDRCPNDLALYIADFVDDRIDALRALRDQIDAHRRQTAA